MGFYTQSDEESVLSSSDRSPTSSLISNNNLIEENLLNDDIKSTSTSISTNGSPESKNKKLPSTSTLIKDGDNNISINNNNNSISKSQRNANNEIFFGGVNKTVNEEELLEIFNENSDNNVLEIRLMKDKLTGESKGFGFVLFNDRSMCRNVIDKLNGKSIKGKIIEVKQSENKRKLFIGNLPKDLSKEQFISIFNEKTEGIESIDFLMSPDQPNKNRGFAFIEYQDHYLADTARRILTASTVKLGDYITTLTVNWSDPDPTTLDPQNDPLENKEIKAIYIRNLPLNHRNDLSITKIINDIIQENSLSLLNNNNNNKDDIIEKIIIPQGAPTLEIINNLNNNLNNNNNSSNINYNNLLSSTSVEPNNINNNNKYTQKFYQELENNINWKKSKFLDLEKYILQSLDSNERVKLKLLNPLGVADKLYSEFDEEYRSQQSVLDFDFENINLAVAQINEHQIDLNKDLRHQLERIDTILLRMENRANTFLDNEIQFSNLLKLLRGEEIRNQFEKHVIDGTNQEIEQLVRNLVDNIVDKNTKRWKSIIDLINQKSSNKSQKVVGFIRDTHDSSDFSSNRQQTINDMGERTTKTLSSYDRDNESLLVSRDIKNAIYQAILFEAGTVGVATILSTAFFDLTGVLGIGALAITGLAWVPFKKAQLKRSISSKITNLRLQLHDTIQDHIGEEIRISSNKIQLGIQPYIDFTNNESKKINDLSIKLGECKDERQTLIYDIEKYFK